VCGPSDMVTVSPLNYGGSGPLLNIDQRWRPLTRWKKLLSANWRLLTKQIDRGERWIRVDRRVRDRLARLDTLSMNVVRADCAAYCGCTQLRLLGNCRSNPSSEMTVRIDGSFSVDSTDNTTPSPPK